MLGKRRSISVWTQLQHRTLQYLSEYSRREVIDKPERPGSASPSSRWDEAKRLMSHLIGSRSPRIPAKWTVPSREYPEDVTIQKGTRVPTRVEDHEAGLDSDSNGIGYHVFVFFV